MEGIRIMVICIMKKSSNLIGILSGICISLGFIRPFDGVITLSELVLQLSGSRGELSMSCNLVELIGFMLRMMPNYIMILVLGISCMVISAQPVSMCLVGARIE